jgi:hypothetical protein
MRLRINLFINWLIAARERLLRRLAGKKPLVRVMRGDLVDPWEFNKLVQDYRRALPETEIRVLPVMNSEIFHNMRDAILVIQPDSKVMVLRKDWEVA